MAAEKPGARGIGYGFGSHVIEDEIVDRGTLLRELRELFGAPNYRPPVLPAVAMQVHALTKRPDASISEIVELVRRDALLAADVLRRAQTPLYATKIPPRTLEDAAMRIGRVGMRDLVFDVALTAKVFRAKGFEGPMEALRSHSMAVATCAREVAQLTAIPDESAFLCGLLHDVGLAASFHALADRAGSKGRFDLASCAEALRDVHVEAGAQVVKLWKLPDEIQWVVAAHHDPVIRGYVHPTAACVVLGEALAHQLREGESVITALDLHNRNAIEAAREALSLTPTMLERVAANLRAKNRLRRSIAP